MLDGDRISRALRDLGSRYGATLEVMASTGSTNDDAKRAAAAGAPHGAAFLADSQTAGRGRGAHAWHSPPGESIHLSLVLRPDVPSAVVAPITLAFGVVVATIVDRRLLAGGGARIKWPNDVLVGERKIAGVLVEGQLRGGTLQSLVVGVGLNVSSVEFPADLAARATSLRLEGARDLDRSVLVVELIVGLGDATDRFARHGLADVLPELARRDALMGRDVTIGDVRGVASGIDAEGRLLVRDGAGEIHHVVSGTVMT